MTNPATLRSSRGPRPTSTLVMGTPPAQQEIPSSPISSIPSSPDSAAIRWLLTHYQASSLSTEAEPLVLPTISNNNTTSKSAQEASRVSRPPVSSRSTSTKCKCLYLATQMGSLSQ